MGNTRPPYIINLGVMTWTAPKSTAMAGLRPCCWAHFLEVAPKTNTQLDEPSPPQLQLSHWRPDVVCMADQPLSSDAANTGRLPSTWKWWDNVCSLIQTLSCGQQHLVLLWHFIYLVPLPITAKRKLNQQILHCETLNFVLKWPLCSDEWKQDSILATTLLTVLSDEVL